MTLPSRSGPDGACSDPFCSYRAELEFASDGCRAHGCQADRYRHALEEIRDADPVDMALDPNWPARIAKEALSA